MTTGDDPHALKKYEELYKLSRELYAAEHQRFDNAENRVARYLSLLVVLLGVAGVGAAEFVTVGRNEKTWVEWLFLGTYAGAFALGVSAAVCFIRALAVQKVLLPPVDSSIAEHFQKHRHVDVMFSMAKRYMTASESVRTVATRKLRLATVGYRLLLISLTVAVVSLVMRVAVKWRVS